MMKTCVRAIWWQMLVFAVLGAGQSVGPKLDWNQFQSASPLLRSAVEQLSKEGWTVRFQQAEVREFSNLFVVAIVPVEAGTRPPQADRGTVGLMVVLGVVPPPERLVVSEVVRVDYRRNETTKDTEIEGRAATLSSNKTFAFDREASLYLVVDDKGEIREKINRIFQNVEQRLDANCFESVWKTVRARCDAFHEKSYQSWVRCIVSGWLSAKRECGKYTRKPA
jgi:hypothetical protein